jgi:RNA polymerase sigma-70 factor, ECF subfamily
MKKFWNEAPGAFDAPTAVDDALLVLLRQGQPGAYEQLMRRYNRLLFRAARSILRDDAEAEDAVQEAYLRAFKALESFRGESSLGTWLARIVINQALQQQRKRGRLVEWDEEGPMAESEMPSTRSTANPALDESPERATARHELRTQLEQAIDLLPPIYRCVFTLRAVHELSVEETADALGVSSDVVKTRYLRARGLLRCSLDAESADSLRLVHDFQGRRCDGLVRTVMASLRWTGLT